MHDIGRWEGDYASNNDITLLKQRCFDRAKRGCENISESRGGTWKFFKNSLKNSQKVRGVLPNFSTVRKRFLVEFFQSYDQTYFYEIRKFDDEIKKFSLGLFQFYDEFYFFVRSENYTIK